MERNADFALKAQKELEKLLKTLPTRDAAQVSWENNGHIYVADDPNEAIALSNDYAPEHLEVHASDLSYSLERLKNSGPLFLGEETSVAYGDKSNGTNHILPPGRSARFTGGVWVGKFLQTVTYQKMTKQASGLIGEVTEQQCMIERMEAHALTAAIRAERYKNQI